MSKHTDGKKQGNGHHTESLISFPCHFLVKIMGKTQGHFEPLALAIIENHFPKSEDVEIQKHFSKDRHYLSLSVTVYVESQAQLDAFYQDLSRCQEVLMVL